MSTLSSILWKLDLSPFSHHFFTAMLQKMLWVLSDITLYKKQGFLLRISSVSVAKSAGNCVFGHIYRKVFNGKVNLFVQCNTKKSLRNRHFWCVAWKKSHMKKILDQVFLPSEIHLRDVVLTSINFSRDLSGFITNIVECFYCN